MSEQEFVDYMADAGWTVEWISILEEDAGSGTMSQAEAAQWASTYGLDPASVWYDESQEWYSQAVPSGFPTVYSVHTTNMLIWDRSDGWIDSSGPDWDGFLAWWPDFFDYCAAQPGA